MRVLHVIPSVAKAHGGPTRAVAMMERGLRQAGIDFSLATTDDDGPGRRMRPELIKLGHASPGTPGQQPGQYHVFPKYTDFYKFSPSLGTWLMANAHNYDLVHIHALFSYSSWAAARAARHHRIPYVVRPLGTLTRYGVEKRRRWLKLASLRWVEGPYLRHAAAVHFTAQAEQAEAEVLGIPMRSAVVPLAVENDHQPDRLALMRKFPDLQPTGYLLFLSRLDPKKNIEALLDAFADVAHEFTWLRLVVVGDGQPNYVAQLKSRSRSLGIESRVVWTGFLDGPLKAAILTHALLFVLPSFSENFGIAVAEALLAGLPCVLGQGVAIAADIQSAGAGLAVTPDAVATAYAIRYYLQNPAARVLASKSASRFALTHYTVDVMGHNLRRLYEDVLYAHHKGLYDHP